MKENKIVVLGWAMIFVLFLVDPFAQVLCEGPGKGQQKKKTAVSDSLTLSSERSNHAETLGTLDSLMVIHFHPTVQCSCCINVGSFAKRGLEKLFAKPYKEGRIVFRERNSDEDSLTIRKYHLLESALAFQKFSGENNEFKEIESVWEFCEDEEKFLLSFKKELNDFIVGDKKNNQPTKERYEKTKQQEEYVMEKAKEILKTKKIYAVVGVSQDTSKYGYEVFHSLKGAGYKTYPINPKYKEITGCKCYPSLKELPENPEVLILALAPSNSEKIVEGLSKSQIQMLWLPPGCWSDAAIAKCQQVGIPFIYDVCPVGTLLAIKGRN